VWKWATDIAFTSSDGTTVLDHEIEILNSGTGSCDNLGLGFPTLSSSIDTQFLFYDDD